ncbi:hypothetical protein EVAR_37334_1 [Eumeta japonica]|uniref:Uncharacterized protein n=1 Tax=Eumeta variegata TaxID=151549 RepID=A0A4C1X1L6_EUMVA|nr:hypothetical protein EVAR_37334_1 [Eumeta japonica]
MLYSKRPSWAYTVSGPITSASDFCEFRMSRSFLVYGQPLAGRSTLALLIASGSARVLKLAEGRPRECLHSNVNLRSGAVARPRVRSVAAGDNTIRREDAPNTIEDLFSLLRLIIETYSRTPDVGHTTRLSAVRCSRASAGSRQTPASAAPGGCRLAAQINLITHAVANVRLRYSLLKHNFPLGRPRYSDAVVASQTIRTDSARRRRRT